MENEKEQTFSTTEGAAILGMSVQTLRSWLHRAPKLFEQTTPGSWRLLTIDNLLGMRIAQKLMNKGIELEEAANVVAGAYFIKDLPDGFVEGKRISMPDDAVALVLDFDEGEKIIGMRLLGLKGCKEHVGYLFNSPATSQTFIDIVKIKVDLQKSIWSYKESERE
jgi:hypothetical protein